MIIFKDLFHNQRLSIRTSHLGCFLSFFILLVILLSGCHKITDLSHQTPYKKCIGQKFILKKDYYIYQFNDTHSKPVPSLGEPHKFPNLTTGLPKTLDEKYIGTEGKFITLLGVARKGSLFEISSVIRVNYIDYDFVIYNVRFPKNPFTGEVRTYDITDIFHNPPYTKTWSDPPIFKKEYAEPVVEDGIWWK